MQATIRLQKTGYYVTAADGSAFTDETGHGWFSLALARDHARRLGGSFCKGTATTIKEVVQGYQPDALRAEAAAAGITADSPVLDAGAERLAREERWS